MRRSQSEEKKLEQTGHLANSGFSLTDYYATIFKERNKNTLNFRRTSYFNMRINLLKSASAAKMKNWLTSSEAQQAMSVEYAVAALESSNETQISQFAQTFITCAGANIKSIVGLISSEDFLQALTDSLSNDFSNDTFSYLFQVISLVFSSAKDKASVVDSGIIFSIYLFLTNTESPLVAHAASLLTSIAESSSYARDAIVCIGVPSELINIVRTSDVGSIEEAACECLVAIFACKEPMDMSILAEYINPLFELISNSPVSVIASIFHVFIEMTNKQPDIVYNLYNMGLYPVAVESLSVPELLKITLDLIGNLTSAQPPQIRTFIDLGLYSTLTELLSSDYDATVLWIFSNSLEVCPNQILPLFDESFINNLILSSESSSSEAKTEISYLLGTMVKVGGSEISLHFLRHDAFDIFAEMLGCGVGPVVIRCIEAVTLIVRNAISNGQNETLSELVSTCDLEDRLCDLEEDSDDMIRARVSVLQALLDSLSSD